MSIGTNALAWAITRMGQTVGNGECWTLVEQALLASGGRSSRTMTPGANGPGFARLDYVWGTAAALNQVARGDILRVTIETTVNEVVSGRIAAYRQ